MAEPTCPNCSIAGVENIVSQPSAEASRHRNPWFEIIFCKECGHIYGMMTKHVFVRASGSGPSLFVPSS